MINLEGIVIDELYNHVIPIVVSSKEDFFSIKQDDHLAIETDGKVLIKTKSSAKQGK